MASSLSLVMPDSAVLLTEPDGHTTAIHFDSSGEQLEPWLVPRTIAYESERPRLDSAVAPRETWFWVDTSGGVADEFRTDALRFHGDADDFSPDGRDTLQEGSIETLMAPRNRRGQPRRPKRKPDYTAGGRGKAQDTGNRRSRKSKGQRRTPDYTYTGA